ncbi:MAG: hypothetical protein KJ749_09815 [Planctomycetes bacterium]|nr:hypothetical protein [Planctomycetota bacterium]
MSEYVTTGDIARIAGCPLHRVTYAVQRLGIVEDSRAGTYRLFRRDRLAHILAELAKRASEHRDDRNDAAPSADSASEDNGRNEGEHT